MPHHDEKGRIAPAESKVARQMRGSTPLSRRTMAQIAESNAPYPVKEGKHAYGETHFGVSGMARMAKLKEANKGKKAKSRIILKARKEKQSRKYETRAETRSARLGHKPLPPESGWSGATARMRKGGTYGS